MVKRRPVRIVERNALAYRRIWYVFLTGFAEPVLYLLSIGVGVGKLVGDLPEHRPVAARIYAQAVKYAAHELVPPPSPSTRPDV